jgi:hypothetical protein
VFRFEKMLNSRYTVDTVKNFSVWSLKDRVMMERLPAHVFKQVEDASRHLSEKKH